MVAGTVCALQVGAQAAPATLVWRGDRLAAARQRVAAGDRSLQPALDALRAAADQQLEAAVVAVTDKRGLLAPTGDPHDYFSLSPYWWPDPSKPDGLPYIRRDGETNPESKRDLDEPRVRSLDVNVSTLALAAYFTGDARYAARAARQIKAWFLDPATRMNPHLRFSQNVRGNPDERGSGIIDARHFIAVVDAARLLEGTPAFTASDAAALKGWMRDYLQWLRTSPNGAHEHDAKNNHGSWYAAQAAAIAMYVGDSATVRTLAEEAKARIGWQIAPDGSQAEEMVRTRSLHYSAFNLEALSTLAELARHVGVDLWRYEAPSGGSLRRALDRVAMYAPRPAEWPGPQIDPFDPSGLVETLRRAHAGMGAPVYASVLAALPAKTVATARSALLYP
jgi:hypothetical protein